MCVDDQLRVAVVGTSGSGKTTLARTLACRWQVPHIELDALYWLPDWQPRPEAEFRDLVRKRFADRVWISCGNYAVIDDLRLPRVRVVIWLDYARPVVMRRVLCRTLRRSLLRTRVCGDNVESIRTSLFGRESIVAWAWSTYHRNRERYFELQRDPGLQHLN